MYGRILGFHLLVRCPKWTPESRISLTTISDTLCSPDDSPQPNHAKDRISIRHSPFAGPLRFDSRLL